MDNQTILTKEITATFITPKELLEHWQGHRSLTRRVIEAFPEKDFFQFSLGGMRPFSEIARELMGIAYAGIRGIVKEDWEMPDEYNYHKNKLGPKTKEEFLKLWDETTLEINSLWPHLSLSRFHEVVVAFGQFETPVFAGILYWIDNENHHRGQGYVYLRALGITPPPFWER